MPGNGGAGEFRVEPMGLVHKGNGQVTSLPS